MTQEVNATAVGSILNSQLLDMKTILLTVLYVLVVVWVVRRYRAWRFKTSPASRDEMLVNRQLPSWVRPVELLSAIVFFIFTVIGLMFITMLAHYLVHPNAGQLSKTASFFLFVDVILAAPVALLMANLVS